MVVLAAMPVLGRFMGTLPTASAVCLLLAPFGAWIPESPGLRRLHPWARTILRLVLVAIPLFLVASAAEKKFNAEAESAEF